MHILYAYSNSGKKALRHVLRLASGAEDKNRKRQKAVLPKDTRKPTMHVWAHERSLLFDDARNMSIILVSAPLVSWSPADTVRGVGF